MSVLVAGGSCAVPCGLAQKISSPHVPAYAADGRLQPPRDYREWVYLTSGLDMSYTPRVAGTEGLSMFDNVFVNPEAYKAFVETGTWPDKTMLVLEVRGAQSKASINKSGHFQGTELMGEEVHVKDAGRGGWAFYSLDEGGAGKMIPKDAACYSCHQEHAAVDTTFVQFYCNTAAAGEGEGDTQRELFEG